MDRETICGLIDKYFEGQTSLDEEQRLRDYFRHGKVASEWEIYTPVFNCFSEEREISQTTLTLKPERKPNRHLWVTLLSAAACALLLIVPNWKNIWENGYKSSDNHSLAYIDGRKYTDVEILRSETLNSLANLEESDGDVCSLQVEALKFFTDE